MQIVACSIWTHSYKELSLFIVLKVWTFLWTCIYILVSLCKCLWLSSFPYFLICFSNINLGISKWIIPNLGRHLSSFVIKNLNIWVVVFSQTWFHEFLSFHNDRFPIKLLTSIKVPIIYHCLLMRVILTPQLFVFVQACFFFPLTLISLGAKWNRLVKML